MLRRNSILGLALCACLVGSLAAQNGPKPLTNDDVTSMLKGGLSESTVIGAIQSQQSNFDISATALLQLKKSGVSPKVMDAMFASAKRQSEADAAAKEKAATAKAVAPAPAPVPGQPSVIVAQGSQKQTVPAIHTQLAQTKTKASTLGALASDGVLTQALTGMSQGLATAGMMHPGTGMATSAAMAMPMVAPAMLATSLLGHRKQTVTEVWAIPGPKADTVIHTNQPAFEVQYADVVGVNADDYEAVLLKLEPTSSNFRLVGATQAKQDQMQTNAADWELYMSFVEERVGVSSKKIATGKYELQATLPLAPGEYGVALRPINKDKKFSGSSIAQNTGDGVLFNSIWAFEIQQ